MLNEDKLNKYFWDHTHNASPVFKLRRLIEYAQFPDLLKIPFDEIKQGLGELNVERLRTSEKRKEFIKRLLKVINKSSAWEDAIFSISGNNQWNGFSETG